MVLFVRKIEDICIRIAYEDDLYYYDERLNNAIFSTFNKIMLTEKQADSITVDVYFGFKKSNIINTYAMHIHDRNDKGFMLLILHELEFYFSYFLKCVSLHGAAIQINNRNFLIMGARNSGKSTLTYSLMNEDYTKYVDDDCIYLYNKEVIGFNFPIRLRKIMDENCEIIYEGIDADDNKRFLYMPLKCIDKLEFIDYVIFPQYDSKYGFDVKYLGKGEIYNNIINNVKKSEDTRQLFGLIARTFKHSNGMKIRYSNCAEVCHYLNSISK